MIFISTIVRMLFFFVKPNFGGRIAALDRAVDSANKRSLIVRFTHMTSVIFDADARAEFLSAV